jgi:hypothetical protein
MRIPVVGLPAVRLTCSLLTWFCLLNIGYSAAQLAIARVHPHFHVTFSIAISRRVWVFLVR